MSSSTQTPSGGQSGLANPAPRSLRRRTFTAEYQARIVGEYEAAPRGEKSAVMRRESLFHSHVCGSGRLTGKLAQTQAALSIMRAPQAPTTSQLPAFVADLTNERGTGG